MKNTIELDCAPGDPRPGDLIDMVVQGTALEGLPEAQPGATVSRFFGHWVWEFPTISKKEWERTVRPVVKPRIEALHKLGKIRYGSW